MSVPDRTRRAVLPCLLLLSAAASAQSPAPAPAALDPSPAECEVWTRELSFAQSVADHDEAAFAEHVHPDAAFGAGNAQPTRGRDAVVRQWRGLIEGKGLRLAWYPIRVTVAGDGNIAWSTGPALFEDPSPSSPQRYRLGQFHSVWQRGADGVWRVLFDDGPEPRPATADEAAAFHAGRRTCPAA